MRSATKKAGSRNIYLKCLGVNTGENRMLFSYLIISAYLSFKTRSYASAYYLLFSEIVKERDEIRRSSNTFFLSSTDLILRIL